MQASITGMIASMMTWMLGAIKWYSVNLPDITAWMVHIAQIGGLVIVWLSIKILLRNLKNGSNSIDPTEVKK